jgi:hypothetical protein
MLLEFLKLPPNERRVYFEQAGIQQNISPIVLEKDFWVCWLLGILFQTEFAKSLVFKGGTSLSKVYGVINRFSEDIDLSLAPSILELPQAGRTRTQADKWMKAAEAACGRVIETVVMPVLEERTASVLGPADERWLTFLDATRASSPIVLFHYPTALPDGFSYLPRSVRLEFGSLTDQQPSGRYQVTPWIANSGPQAFGDWTCEVVTLELERTVWEKATILHAEFHRPATKPTPDRFSRHYADVAAMAGHTRAAAAFQNGDLCHEVAAWKSRFFGSAWASYATAIPGSLRLVPPVGRIPELRRDYQAMRAMYLDEPLSFEAVLEKLAALESLINSSAGKV